jgi:hypothetical protein
MVPSSAVLVDLVLEMCCGGGIKYRGMFCDVELAVFLELRNEFENLLMFAE